MTSPEESVIDIRGQVCPSSLLLVLRSLNQNAGAVRDGSLSLRILIDNRDATVTIPNAVVNMGFQAYLQKVPEGYYEVVISHEQD